MALPPTDNFCNIELMQTPTLVVGTMTHFLYGWNHGWLLPHYNFGYHFSVAPWQKSDSFFS